MMKKNTRSFIAGLLVLALMLTCFVGCTKEEPKPTEPQSNANVGTVEDVIAWIKNEYKDDGAVTATDFKRYNVIRIAGTPFNVVWTASVGEDLVKIVDNGDGTATFDLNQEAEAETAYTLTATVTDANGKSLSHTWNYTLPKGMSMKNIVEEAYKLEVGAAMDKAYTLTGVIIKVDSAYSEQYKNVTVTIEVAGVEDKPIMCYRVKGDGADKIDVGDTITVSGIIKNYNGTIEFDQGCTLDAWVDANPGTETPTEPNATEPSATQPSTPATQEPAADSKLSIKDAIALGLTKESDNFTTNKYYVTGEITEIYNTTYGNMKIKDSAGNILTLYGTYSADGSTRFDKMTNQPAVGATITVYGVIGQYNGTAQMKNGWIKEIVGGGTTTPTTPTTPSAPSAGLSVVANPEVGVAYKFGMVQENVSASDVYFLAGGMNGYYMESTKDASKALDVYLEATNGGYYLYAMDGGTKLYINMVLSGTHVNGAYEATAKTVYTYDASSQTLTANMKPYDDKDAEPYWFGTRNDKTYTTIGPCAVSYAGFYCKFYK